jgi:cytochrome c oxidase assembly protein subunit 15
VAVPNAVRPASPADDPSGGALRPRWLRPILIANLIAQIGIVLTGGTVRLTGSGLGCPSFPECVPGSYIPVAHQEQGIHKLIEFGNRTLISVLSVLAIAALVMVVRYLRAGQVPDHRRRGILVLGAVPLVGVAVQALIGGITVLTSLNPTIVAVHFLVSMSLIAGSAWLLFTVAPRDGAHAAEELAEQDLLRPEVRWLSLGVAAVLAVVLALGTVVTGSGPHSGDADEPNRFGFNVRDVAWLHADAVWLFVGLVVALVLALRLTGAGRTAVRRSYWLLGLTMAQGAVGFVQYLTGVPAVLVGVHMLGASLLVLGMTATLHAVLARPLNPQRAAEHALA